MKAWRSVAAIVVAAGGAAGVGAWSALGQEGTPSQPPRQRQEDRTRSPSRQEQPPPRQDDRERRDRRDRDRDQDRDRDGDGVFDDDDDEDRGDVRRSRDRLTDQRDANTRGSRRRPFAFDDPNLEAQFNRTVERLASQERELLQRNQDLLRRLGDARSGQGDQRLEALAAVLQESLLEQERVLRYLADARAAWAGDVSPGDRLDEDGDGTLRQDRRRDDRRTPAERPADDRGRDGDGDRRPGRSEQPRQNPR